MAKDKVLQAIIKLKDDFSKPLKGVKANMEALGKSVNSTKKTLADFNDGMSFTGKNMVKVGATLTAVVGGAFAVCTKNAIEFESAWTGVLKTVNGSPTQLEGIKQGLIDLSNRMPKTASELAGIAEIAGQLGIETDNIVNFTETMAKLADTTNIVGEEGALQLAKFMNVMGTSQSDVDRLGSSIVALGNNFSTTEADILNMASRLSDLGILFGFNETQVLAWSTAMSSAGIEAEMGGTAMKKMVTEIERATLSGGDSLNQFAKIAGTTAEEYKKAFGEDSSKATLMFLQGLNKIQKEGGSVSQVLDEMDIKEVRLRETIIKLASTHEDVAKALGMSSEAWKQNGALNDEAKLRYETTESALKIMRNQINNATLDIGNALLPIIRDLVEWVAKIANGFANLNPNLKEFIVKAGLITLGIGTVLAVGGTFLMFIAGVTTALTALGGVAGITAGIIAFLTSPITLVIVAIGLLIASVALLKKAWDNNWNGVRDKTLEVVDKIKGWWNDLKEFLAHPIQGIVNIVKKSNEQRIENKKGQKSAWGTKRVVGNDVPYRLHDGNSFAVCYGNVA